MSEPTSEMIEAGEAHYYDAAGVAAIYLAMRAADPERKALVEALEVAEADLLNISDGCGYRYQHGTIGKAVSAAIARVRTALRSMGGDDEG